MDRFMPVGVPALPQLVRPVFCVVEVVRRPGADVDHWVVVPQPLEVPLEFVPCRHAVHAKKIPGSGFAARDGG